MIGSAIETLNAIRYYLTPPRYRDEFGNEVYGDSVGLLAMLVNGLLGLLLYLVEALEFLLLRLSYFETQRAEYFADALATGVAGRSPVVSSLKKMMLDELIQRELLGYARLGKPDGMALINRLAKAVRHPKPEVAAELVAKATADGNSIDASHPATHFRIDFLQALHDLEPRIVAADIDFAAIDAELAPHIERLGLDLDADLEPY